MEIINVLSEKLDIFTSEKIYNKVIDEYRNEHKKKYNVVVTHLNNMGGYDIVDYFDDDDDEEDVKSLFQSNRGYRYICICGGELFYHNRNRHRRSKKHIKFIKI